MLRRYTKKQIYVPQEKPGKENAYVVVANTCEDANHPPLTPNRQLCDTSDASLAHYKHRDREIDRWPADMILSLFISTFQTVNK